jgi:cobalt-zinc-cadmium efflux system outer membrane protein
MFVKKKYSLLLISFTVLSVAVNAQVLTADEAVKRTMENNPRVQAALLEIEKSKQLQKSSVNIPNPEFMFESTTGEYQTLGVLQSLDFPTVYAKQHSINKQRTELSKLSQQMTRAEVEGRVRAAYLEAQYYLELVQRLQQRDSAYAAIEDAAHRKFMAGEIDALASSYAKLQHADVHRTMTQTQVDLETAMQSLNLLMQTTEALQLEKLNELHLSSQSLQRDSTLVPQTLFMRFAEEQKRLSEQQLSLERNKALPGLVFGYLNQADSKTPLDMRLRGGLTLPLWWWQYSGNIKAAKAQVSITELEAKQQRIDVSIRLNNLFNEYKKYKTSLLYFENEGLEIINKMRDHSQRLFETGSIDYITHLRNLNDAFLQEYAHLETLYLLNKTIIQLNYLTQQ